MVENDQNNDEYKFIELDGPNDELLDDNESLSSSFAKEGNSSSKDIKRNALIVLGLVILVMLIYKLIGYYVTKEKAVEVVKTPTQVQQPIQIQPSPVEAPLTLPVQPAYTGSDNSELTRKVARMEISQENVRSEVGNVSQQVGVMSSNVNSLNQQVTNLTHALSNLSNQLAKQTEELNHLRATHYKKRVIKKNVKLMEPRLGYSIQAVIPGRAWLIASNGSTITVREGTKIDGYGVVKLIDSLDGRILTSSGQVIRFSQDDS
jgi:intracellular multiplication protein IcmG